MVQVLDGIYLYTQKEQSPEYYRPLKKYLKMTFAYIIIAALLFGTPVRDFIFEYLSLLPMIYLLIVPIPIAIYKWKITKKWRLVQTEGEDIINSSTDEFIEIEK